MKKIGTCNTCTYWGTPENNCPPITTWNHCHHLKLLSCCTIPAEDGDITSDCLVAESEDEGWEVFYTGPDFGCIHHEDNIALGRTKEYEKCEFCKQIKCECLIPESEELGIPISCNFSHDKDCIYTAREFHHWLKENGFKIIKETINEI